MTDLTQRLAQLSPKQREALLQRLGQTAVVEEAEDRIPRLPAGRDRFLLSSSQLRQWILDRLEPGSSAYNLPVAVRLRGALDPGALAGSLQDILRRHASLRTTFEESEGEPAQRVHPFRPRPLPVVDLRALPAAEREERVEALAEGEAGLPFDLQRGPLLRARLLRLGREEHVLLYTLHHIVSDGWSTGVLFRELGAGYEARRGGEEAALPELPVQYTDYAAWQRRRLDGETLGSLLAFWRPQLTGLPPLLTLPADRPRPAVQDHRGAAVTAPLAPALTAALRRLGQERSASLFMVLLAAFYALLHRSSGQRDLPVGTFIANRSRSEIADLIGFFVNTLVLRVRLVGEPTFAELLAQVREVTLGAFAHQELPFERLIEELQPERDTSHTPFFQTMLVLQNQPGRDLHLEGLSVSYLGAEHRRAAFDLTLWAWDHGEVLTLVLNYRTDLFDATTVRRFAGQLRRLLDAAVADPGQRLGAMPLLAGAEVQQLTVEWQDSARHHLAAEAAETLAHQLLSRRAVEVPAALAVEAMGEGEARRLSYGELETESNRLAHHLRALGVGPEVVVGLAVERSPEMLVAMFGILKAGGAYLPLDSRYPAERIAYQLADSGARALVTREAHLRDLAPALPAEGLAVLRLDADRAALAARPAAAPEVPVSGDNAAYVIYTSGSTGKPKGVVVPHRALVHYALYAAEAYGFGTGDRMLQFASISFDASGEEIYPCLARGGTLVLRDDSMLESIERFTAELGRWGVTALSLPTAFWHDWVAALSAPQGPAFPAGCRLVLIGGEKALPEGLAGWRRCAPAACRLLNTYGPTEATIVAVNTPLGEEAEAASQAPGAEVPLGRPIADVLARVLDRRLRPVGVGLPGELCLGGAGLARGYLGRPGRTAETFVPDPLAAPGAAGSRLYRTGDLVRHRGDGQLEFRGRLDAQVKVRGFRVEPGEVEALLLRHPGVESAAVEPRPSPTGTDLRLVAYVVPAAEGEGAPEARELRDFLRSELPDYMLPAAFVFLPELPKTASGKVDRRALPAPEGRAAELEKEHLAPRTPTEEVLAAIWGEMLGLERVGVGDSFFELGGHSLLAARLASRVRGAFEVELPLLDIFNTPTIAELAGRIERAERADRALELPPIQPAPRDRPLPVSFPQEQVWFIQQLVPDNLAYNFQLLIWLDGALDLELFNRSLTEIVRRHEIYRTTFPAVEGEPSQRIHPPWRVLVPVIDFTALPAEERADIARRELRHGIFKPFDVERLPLLRWCLLKTGEREHAFLHGEHHFVHDGWSIGVFLKELIALYEAFAAGEPSPLPELAVQYADWAVWQRQWMQGPVLDRYVEHWREQLAGAPPELALPMDRPRPRLNRLKGDLWGDLFTPADYEAIRAFSRREGVTLFVTLSAVFAAVLARHSGQRDVVQGLAVANRRLKETEALIGMMVNTLVLRTRFDGDPTFRDLLRQVRRSSLDAYNFQDLPMDQLVQRLQPERDLSRNPLYQVMFSFHDAQVPIVEFAGLKARMEGYHNRSAKTDLNVVALPRAEQHVGLGRPGREETLGITWEFNREIFDRTTIRRLIRHFRTLLMAAVAAPERPVAELPMLSAGERQQVAAEWNDTRRAPGPLPFVHRAIAAQARRRPTAPAVEAEAGSLSYGELAARVRRLAAELRRRGAGPGAVVGLLAERSPAMVVGLLAALEAGAAYLPLDPSYPEQRLAFMLADAGAGLLLAEAGLAERLPPAPGRQVISLGTVMEEELAEEEIAAALREDPPPLAVEDLAYVIYTSGSTGEPKGVMVSHGGLANYLAWAGEAYGAAAGEGSLVHSPLSFDLTVTSLLLPLAAGNRVRLLPPDPGIDRLAETLEASRDLSLLKLTPTHLEVLGRRLAEAGPAGRVRALVVGGEALLAEHLARWRREAPDTRVINEYGPTETVVGCAVEALRAGDAGEGGAVPIGRPIAGATLALLDPRGQRAAIGVVGELSIGGAGVARGYLGRPGLTAERFVPDPAAARPGSRLYQSGDLARLLPDGRMVYLGRRDHQVKVRGFRVEVGEVEAVLAGHPGITEAAVLLRRDAAGDPTLVAWAATGGDGEAPSAGDLRAFLRQRLPEHMVPSAFVLLPELPLTANGKVDREALPDPEGGSPVRETAYVPPRDELEEALAAIWGEVLGRERIGVRDSFFDIGGHSLSATRVLARVEARRGIQLPLAAFFQASTVEKLAALIRRQEGRRPEEGELPLGAGALEPALAAEDLSDAELDALLGELMGEGEAR